MSFLVESGAGLANANALVSVADCDAFHALRSATTWTGANELKEAAIVKATDFLCSGYAWVGMQAVEGQALCWPRIGDDGINPITDPNDFEVAIDAVPAAVANACCVLALEALVNGSLTEALDRGGMVKSEKIGPIEVVYSDGAPGGKQYPAVRDALVRAGLVKGGASLPLVRV